LLQSSYPSNSTTWTVTVSGNGSTSGRVYVICAS
jgi:hypothetical protein